MIRDSLKLIREELNNYVELNGGTDGEVVLGNIGLLETNDGADLREKLVISLVNIEEERTLKNGKSLQRNNLSGTVDYQNPPIHLNLYVLLSANYFEGTEAYDKALQKLSLVIKFFQKKNVFTLSSSTDDSSLESIFDTDKNDIRLIFNIYTMTFEQLNHLWGSLGGKQVPSVMYRCWLVELQDAQVSRSGALIEEIQSQENIT